MKNENILGKIFIIIAMFVMTIPVFAFEEQNQNQETSNKNKDANFCQELQNVQARVLKNLSKKEDNLHGKKNEHTTKLEERFTVRDKERMDHRNEKDIDLTLKIAKLKEKYPDAKYTLAISLFEKTMKDALIVRRNAIDAAVANFRNDLQNVISGKQSTADGMISSLETSIGAAVKTALNSCNQGISSATIKATFQKEISEIRKNTKIDKDNVVKLQPQIEQLANKRKADIDKAQDAFKVTAEGARRNLKEALAK